MITVHISEAEAVRDFASLLERVRAGEEVVIEAGTSPIAVLRAANPVGPVRTLSEYLQRAGLRAGRSEGMDEDFAADMKEIIRNRKPRVSRWDEPWV